MTTISEIISDEEVARVHGNADFGPMPPREVINEGVLKYAIGYTSGHTQLCILLKHELIYEPRPGKYCSALTKKGQQYARALYQVERWRDAISPAEAAKVPEIAALIRAARVMNEGIKAGYYRTSPAADALEDALRALAGSSDGEGGV